MGCRLSRAAGLSRKADQMPRLAFFLSLFVPKQAQGALQKVPQARLGGQLALGYQSGSARFSPASAMMRAGGWS